MQYSSLNLSAEIKQIFSFDPHSKLVRPLLGSSVSAGFPSPAQDYIEAELDLNEHLVAHPAATYFVRVAGNSMTEAGIFDNDILIVDRSLEPAHRKIVIAILDGELTVKRLLIKAGKWFLQPENSEFSALEITAESDLIIWGVVVFSIHRTN
ncbi:MAG: translesion error-prone DNA polymerase V autoproteolytic subunit [Candidatus Cloacimonadales bacterium]